MNSANQGTVEHYRNTGYTTPSYLSSTDTKIGFTSISVSVVNGQLVCSFSRLKSLPSVQNYFDFKSVTSYFILTASGTLGANGKLKQKIKIFCD